LLLQRFDFKPKSYTEFGTAFAQASWLAVCSCREVQLAPRNIPDCQAVYSSGRIARDIH
jgi:hypothetical protein